MRAGAESGSHYMLSSVSSVSIKGAKCNRTDRAPYSIENGLEASFTIIGKRSILKNQQNIHIGVGLGIQDTGQFIYSSLKAGRSLTS